MEVGRRFEAQKREIEYVKKSQEKGKKIAQKEKLIDTGYENNIKTVAYKASRLMNN